MTRSIVLCADADATVGTGHMMRCITLGSALAGLGCRVTLATTIAPEALRARAAKAGLVPVTVAPGWDPAAVLALAPDAVVLDGYQFAPLAAGLRGAVTTVVIDDDGRTGVSGVDLIVDTNLGADPKVYVDRAQQVLVGSEYALIRPDVLGVERRVPDVPVVLVALGGSDPAQATVAMSRALLAATDARLAVAIGAANERAEDIRAFAAADVRVGIADPDLIDAYAAASVAVVGAGIQLWECAVLAIPAVAFVVADNQVPGAYAAAEAGCAVVVDARVGDASSVVANAVAALLADPARRAAMASVGPSVCDGEGVARVAEAVVALPTVIPGR